MSTRFFANRRDNTLIDKFAGVFSNNPDAPDAPQVERTPDIIIFASFT